MRINKLYKNKKKFAIGGDIYEDANTYKTANATKQDQQTQNRMGMHNSVSSGLMSSGNVYAMGVGAAMQASSKGKAESSDEYGNYEGMTEGGANGGRGTFKGRVGKMLTGGTSANNLQGDNWKYSLLDWSGVGNAYRDIAGAEGYNKVFGKSSSERNKEETERRRAEILNTQRLYNQNITGQFNEQDSINRGFSTSGNYDTQFYGKDGGKVSKIEVKDIKDPKYQAYKDSLTISDFTNNLKNKLETSKDNSEYRKYLEDTTNQRERSSQAFKNLSKLNNQSPRPIDVVMKKLPTVGVKEGNEASNSVNVYQKPKVEVVVKKEENTIPIKSKGLSSVKEEFKPNMTMLEYKKSSSNNPKQVRKLVYSTEKGYEKDPKYAHYENQDEFEKGGTILKKGGKLNQVSNDTLLATGKTHSEGGIKLSPNIEIEDEETLKDKGDSFMVMSNKLKNPETGNTFAKDDLKLASLIGKLESNRNPNKSKINILQDRRSKLENLQQSMNGDNSNSPKQDLGGIINGQTPLEQAIGFKGYPYEKKDKKTKKLANGGNFFAGTYGDEPIVEDFGIQGDTNKYNTTKPKTNRLSNLYNNPSTQRGLRQVGNMGYSLGDYVSETQSIKDLQNTAIPNPILQEGVMLNRVNMDKDRADVNRSLANTNQYYDRGLSDSNASAATKAGLFAQGIEAKQGINQAERNANNQIANQQTGINLGINQQNNALRNTKNQAEMQKQIDIINSKRERNNKLFQSFRDSQNTGRQERSSQTQSDIDIARLDPQGREYLKKYLNDRQGYDYGRKFNKGGKLSKMFC